MPRPKFEGLSGWTGWWQRGTEEGGAKEPLRLGWPCVPGTCLPLEYSLVLETSRPGLEPKSLLTRSVAWAESFGVSLLLFPHANPVRMLGYYPNPVITITGYLPLTPSAPIPRQFPPPISSPYQPLAHNRCLTNMREVSPAVRTPCPVGSSTSSIPPP